MSRDFHRGFPNPTNYKLNWRRLVCLLCDLYLVISLWFLRRTPSGSHPITSIQAAVLPGLRDVLGGHCRRFGQVGHGAGDFEDAVVANSESGRNPQARKASFSVNLLCRNWPLVTSVSASPAKALLATSFKEESSTVS